jgi:Mrp family chromosome partitioning ATPase
MNRAPSQPTMQDLLRPVAAHRLLLVVVVALAIGASVAYSAAAPRVYRSDASVSYQDETYDLGLVGLAAPSTQTGDQLAAAGAQTILQPSVATQVARAIGSDESADSLLGDVSATVSPNSNLVIIEASASSPAKAQRLANAFASAGAAATNAHVRALYATAYRAAATQVRGPRNDPAQALVAQDVSRLRVLSRIATAAQVVKPAELPTAPSSPRPLRNGLLAAVLGLVLGLLAVYLRDSFDRRLKTASDAEAAWGLPLLGRVHDEALGSSPRNQGERVATPADWELFQIMRRNFDYIEPDQVVRSVAVSSALPEEGKSTVSSFLAFANAAAGKRTLLIECDLRRPSLAKRLGIAEAPGLSDYVLGEASLDDIGQTITFTDPLSTNGSGPATARSGLQQPKHSVTCVTAGSRIRSPVEVLRSRVFTSLLEEAHDAFDLVVLDTPPFLSVVDTLELLPAVDAIVVCVRVQKMTHPQAKAGKAALSRLPDRPTGMVVTGAQQAEDREYGYYGYYG